MKRSIGHLAESCIDSAGTPPKRFRGGIGLPSDSGQSESDRGQSEASPSPILVKIKSQAGIEDEKGNPCPLTKKDLVKFRDFQVQLPGRVNPYPHSKKDLVKFEISNFKNRQNRQFSKGGPL